MHFLQFCTDLSKKPKSVKIIYIYASESSHDIYSESDMIYRGFIGVLATVLEILAVKTSKNSQQKFNKF